MRPIDDQVVGQLVADVPDFVRAIAKYHRREKELPLEDFVIDLQSFEREFYENRATYYDMKSRAIRFFKTAHKLGLAIYRLGRRKQPTRLIWRVDPTELVKRAALLDVEVKELITRAAQPTPEEKPANERKPMIQLLTHADIAKDVREVLEHASKGKGNRAQLLSAYQILDRLPQRDDLIAQRGLPGKDAGVHHAAASVVRDAIRFDLKDEVETFYFDNGGVVFEVAGAPIRAGFPVCGLYRLSDGAGADV